MSTEVQTFVFFDIETTGLPWQEKNQTKIIEISFVATSRPNIISCNEGTLPPVKRFTTIINPQRPIHPKVTELTGISNYMVRRGATFKQKFQAINAFFSLLKQPVCLIAHNGNAFDYKILLAECIDADVRLPTSLLCADSIVGFRKLLKEEKSKSTKQNNDIEWPDLNISVEEWNEIDELCNSLSDISCEETTERSTKKRRISKELMKKRDEVISNIFKSKSTNKESYTLSSLYKKLLNKQPDGAHRAENDCKMLLECFIALKHSILPWTDENCKLLTDIEPLQRYTN